MRKLIVDPDPRLRKMCAEVTKFDSHLEKLAQEMMKFVSSYKYELGGAEYVPLGLAAPQMGELIQLFILYTPAYSLAICNPRITKVAHPHKVYESCLSLPGRLFVVERPKIVKFKGLGLDGVEKTVKLHDDLAQAAVHEMEHLRGILLDNVAAGEVPQKLLHT